MSNQGDFVVGKVDVHATEGKGHDPEFWAAQATKKICDISIDAPEHVKAQAVAFQNQIYTVILYTIKNAIESRDTTLINLLIKQGHEDMAKIIKEL